MKYALLSLILLPAIASISCNNPSMQSVKTTKVTDTSKVVENKIQVPKTMCYAAISDKDTIRLKVEVFKNVVIGSLLYQFHEKDKNQGDFEGQLRGDTLIADYKFMSEGILSTREIIFLIRDSIAIEGHGAMEDQNGKMVFKDWKGLSFDKGLILKEVLCNE
jgi:hypothetical protein